jgi:hypothetical protein
MRSRTEEKRNHLRLLRRRNVPGFDLAYEYELRFMYGRQHIRRRGFELYGVYGRQGSQLSSYRLFLPEHASRLKGWKMLQDRYYHPYELHDE